MVSAVICMSLPWVWHLYSLPYVYALFRFFFFQVLLQNMFLALSSIGSQGTKIIWNIPWTCCPPAFYVVMPDPAAWEGSTWPLITNINSSYASSWSEKFLCFFSSVWVLSIFVMLSYRSCYDMCKMCHVPNNAISPYKATEVWSCLISLIYILLMKLSCHMKIFVQA